MTDYRCDHGEVGHCVQCKLEYDNRTIWKKPKKKKKMAKKDKMVTIPNLFLEITGDVYLVDTSVEPNIRTKLDQKILLDAANKVVQDALTLSLKQKGKK